MDFLTDLFNQIAEMLKGIFEAIRGMFDVPNPLA